jgi:hypothetical protein
LKNKRKSDTDKENELLDRIDCLGRNIANLRSDIPDLVRDTVLQIMKDRKPRRQHIEVGYT